MENGEKMKKLKSILALIFCVLASSVLGACSCSKTDITVTKITLSNFNDQTVSNNQLNVVVDDEFFIEYTLAPNKATNTKVMVNIIDGRDYVSVLNGDYIVERTHQEKVYFKALKEGKATIQFKSDSGDVSQNCEVVVHKQPEALNAPEISFDYASGNVKWTAITPSNHVDIKGYGIWVNDTLIDTTSKDTIIYSIANLGATNNIKVQALGDGIYNANSQFSNTIVIHKLEQPKNVVVNNGKISWSEITNSITQLIDGHACNIQYVVTKSGQDPQIVGALEYPFGNAGEKAYTISVYAQVEGDEFKKGVSNDGVLTYVYRSTAFKTNSITTLSTPNNFQLVSTEAEQSGSAKTSYLKWNAVTGATSYKLVIKNASTTVEQNLDVTRFNLDESLEAGVYTAYVVAQGNAQNNVYGDAISKSQEIELVKLPYLTATVNTQSDKLAINLQPLYELNLNSEQIAKLDFELYFVNVDSSETNQSVFYKHTDGTTEIDLHSIPGLTGGSYRCYVRPVYGGENLTSTLNVANSDKNFNVMPLVLVNKLYDAVVNSISSEGLVNFTGDSNATAYNIKITEDDVEIKNYVLNAEVMTVSQQALTTQLNVNEFASGKTYKLLIMATSDASINASEAQSNWFEFTKLASVDVDSLTVSINQEFNNYLKWTATNNYGYYLRFNNAIETLANNEYQPAVANIQTAGNLVELTVLGNNINVLNSDTITKTFSRLASPVISNLNGEVYWEEDSEASYILQHYNLEGSAKISSEKITSNYLTSLNDVAESIGVIKVKEGYFNSPVSALHQVKQLSSVDVNSILSVNNTNTINWTAVADANGYVVTYYPKGSTEATAVKTEAVTATNITLPIEGKYCVTIKPTYSGTIASGNMYVLNGNPSAVANIEKLNNPVMSVVNGSLNISLNTTTPIKGFEVTIDGTTYNSTLVVPQPSGNSLVAVMPLEDLTAGTYTVKVVAKGNEAENVIHSEQSTKTDLVKIEKAGIIVENGVLKVTGVTNAKAYEVYFNNGTTDVKLTTLTSDLTVNVGSMTEGTLKVKAIADSNMINAQLSEGYSFVKLSSPQNVQKDAGKLTWSKVDNSTAYVVKHGSDVESVNALEFTLPSLTEIGVYEYTVCAVGNTATAGTYYINGDATSYEIVVLNNPTGLRLTGSVISWNAYVGTGEAIDAPLKTVLKIYEVGVDAESNPTYTSLDTIEVVTTSYDLLQNDKIQNKQYTFSVQFMGDENQIISSKEVRFTGTIDRVAQPVLNVNNGQLMFDEVIDASDYELYKASGDTLTLMNEDEYTLTNKSGVIYVNLVNALDNAVTIRVKTLTTASNSLESYLSNELTVQKLAKPNALIVKNEGETSGTVENGVIQWNEVANARAYEIVEVSNNNASVGEFTNLSVHLKTLGLNLEEKERFVFNIRALGSQAGGTEVEGKTIYYLNSDYSNTTAEIRIVSAVKDVKLENGIVTWTGNSNVESYKLTITISGQEGLVTFTRTDVIEKPSEPTQENQTVQFNLNDDINIDNFTVDANVSVKIEPFYASDTSYYIIKSGEDTPTINIIKPARINKPVVKNGMFMWSQTILNPDVNMLSDLKQLHEAALAGTITSDNAEVYQKYQLYKRYISFDVKVNGIEYKNYIPELENVAYSIYFSSDGITIDAITVEYYFEDNAVLYASQGYSFEVRTSSNNSYDELLADDEATVLVPAVTGLLPGNYSETMTATKYNVVKPTKTSNGNIFFTRVANMDNAKYLLIASPDVQDDSSMCAKSVILTPSNAGTEGLVFQATDDQAVIYDVYNIFKNADDPIDQNITYTYFLYMAGSVESESNGNNAVLRSNNYNTVRINFLSKVGSFDYVTNRSDVEGGVLSWVPNLDVNQKLYLLSNDIYEGLTDKTDWISNENAIVINLLPSVNYFAFDSEEALKYDIAPGRYVSAIAYESDSEEVVNGTQFIEGAVTSYVASKELSDIVNIEKLTSIQLIENNNYSWVKDGKFVWNHNNTGVGNYKVEVYEVAGSTYTLIEGSEQILSSSAVGYTLSEIYNKDKSHGISYAIKVTPLGMEVGNVGYVAANPVTTSGYFRLSSITPAFDSAEQQINWTEVTGADNYTVDVNAKEYSGITVFYYDIGEQNWFAGGIYTVKVKANSFNNTYLTGVYDVNNAVSITKMYEPEVHTQDGVVVWSRSNVDTLVAKKTSVNITPWDKINDVATGDVQKFSIEFDGENIDEACRFELGDAFNPGYYKVDVKFENSQTGYNEYIIGSDVRTIYVTKLSEVEINLGTYNQDVKECKFDNYVKWNDVEGAADYKVKFVNVGTTESPIDANKEEYRVSTDGSMFDEVDGVIFFDISKMVQYGKNKVKIYVTAIGSTIAYSNTATTEAYVSSRETSLVVDNPVNVTPEITSTTDELSKGIVKWDAGTLNCNVEVIVKSGTYYVAEESGSGFTRSLQQINSTKVFKNINIQQGVFHLPFVGNNLVVIIRYYSSNFVSAESASATFNSNLFYAGLGTAENPLMIYSETDNQKELAHMFANIVYSSDNYIKLYSNVDMNEVGFTCLDKISFNGVLDGNGKVVSNLTYADSGKTRMFDAIGANGVIKDITLSFKQESINKGQAITTVTTLAKENNGLIENVKVLQDLTITNFTQLTGGGLVYINNGTIKNVSIGNTDVAFKFTANTSHGEITEFGVIAHTNNGDIVDSKIVNATINLTNYNNTAKLAGIAINNNGTIQTSEVQNNVTLTSNNVGGITYHNVGKVEGCSFVGVINATATSESVYVGGLVSYNEGEVVKSYVSLPKDRFNITVAGQSNVGGLVGYNYQDNTLIDGCYVVNYLSSVTNGHYGVAIGATGSDNITNVISICTDNSSASAVGYQGALQLTGIKVVALNDIYEVEREGGNITNLTNPVFVNLKLLNTNDSVVEFVLNGSYVSPDNAIGNVVVTANNENIPFVLITKSIVEII